MLKKQLSIVGFYLVLVTVPALAKKLEFPPALPQCKPTGELRTPMPIWRPDVRHDGTLSSEPPAGNARTVYIQLYAENDDVHCANAVDNDYYTFKFPSRTKSGDLEVNLRGPARYVGFGAMCSFSGFYLSEVADHDGKRQTNFRPVDKFDVMSSGLYCLEKWTHAMPNSARPSHAAPQAAGNATLPLCKHSGEIRVPISIWRPTIISRDDEPAISSDRPDGDGRIVYISLALNQNTLCPKDPEDLITVSRPTDLKHPESGGLLVNFAATPPMRQIVAC